MTSNITNIQTIGAQLGMKLVPGSTGDDSDMLCGFSCQITDVITLFIDIYKENQTGEAYLLAKESNTVSYGKLGNAPVLESVALICRNLVEAFRLEGKEINISSVVRDNHNNSYDLKDLSLHKIYVDDAGATYKMLDGIATQKHPEHGIDVDVFALVDINGNTQWENTDVLGRTYKTAGWESLVPEGGELTYLSPFTPDVIRTSICRNKPAEPGLLEHARYVTSREIRAQIESCLAIIGVEEFECSALDAAEYIAGNTSWENLDHEINEQTKLLAVAERGHCEGYLLKVLALDESEGSFKTVFRAKYLSSEEAVWNIARRVSIAIEEGKYN